MDLSDKQSTKEDVSSALDSERASPPVIDAQLMWQCHRGMLELDLILQNFVKQHYVTLQPEQAKGFKSLLQCADPQLLTWLLGHSEPESDAFREIVQLIRQAKISFSSV